jgi:predicted NAD/FAD-binding protein
MKIAIIGTGISGLTAAYYLKKYGYDLDLFEAADYVGGHTHTVPTLHDGQTYFIDTGFIVFNKKTYPYFCRLMDELKIISQKTDMSFSVSDLEAGFEYSGGSLKGLFAQKKNYWSPSFYFFLKQVAVCQKALKQVLDNNIHHHKTLEDFMVENHIPDKVIEHYLYPLVSALWSSSMKSVEKMPVYFIAHFLQNHGLLRMLPNIDWEVIPGGSYSYISPLTQSFSDKIHLNTKIEKIVLQEDGINLQTSTATFGTYDKVIMANHSDEALEILPEGFSLQKKLLASIPYQKNSVILHTDSRLMPKNKHAWASWNYLISREKKELAFLTYYMNKLQNLKIKQDFFVTLNAQDEIAADKIIQCFEYHHPQFTLDTSDAQKRHREINKNTSIYFCGAYWGFGFHEDGVKSALVVCEEITGRDLLDANSQ